MFNVMLIDKLEKNRIKTNHRVAVRAIIVRDDKKILMLKSSLGDYRVPGGGVEEGEKLEDSLKREVVEETGLKNIVINRKLGETTRIKNDKKEENSIIEMKNHYFLCILNSIDSYKECNSFSDETNMDIEWISIVEALENNKRVYEEHKNKEVWMKNSFPIFNAIINECKELI